tara:strand:+ start:6813 stop:7379 length:567 start_codon:yes stop_codon:yes gene_type:complete
MNLILLTTTQRVKDNSSIQNNVDDKLIAPYIKKAQFTHIHQLLGTKLYEKVLSDVETGTLTGNYKILVDRYVTPCLIEWTVYEVMPFISLKLDNKSISKGKSDYSDAGDLNDLKYLRQTVRDLALFYNQRIIDYLKTNTSLFQEYLTNSNLDEIKPTNRTNMIGGVYLGDGGRSKCDFGLGDKNINLI